MAVLNQHMVKDDLVRSTDWTTIGARILEAATIASAVHMEELTHAAPLRCTADNRWNREITNGNG